MLLYVSRQATFTHRARRDCIRLGLDEPQLQDVLDDPVAVRQQADPGDANTVFIYVLGRLPDARWLEIMCEARPDDRRFVRRVCVFPEDWGA